MKVEIVGGQHDGEIYDVPNDFRVPRPTESLTENTVNLAYTEVELAKLKAVVDILNAGPGIMVREFREKPSWQK